MKKIRTNLQSPPPSSVLMTQEEEAYYDEHNWQTHIQTHKGQDLLYLYRPAENPKGVFILGQGFNSNPYALEIDRKDVLNKSADPATRNAARENIFQQFNDQNISVLVAVLPKIAPSDRAFLSTLKNANDHFMFSESSPIFTLLPETLDKNIMAHSARGLVTMQSLLSPDHINFAKDHYNNIFIMNPMLDMTMIGNRQALRTLYNLYASIDLPKLRIRDSVAGKTWLDKVVMRAHRIELADDYPSHGQNTAMGKAGSELLKTFQKASFADSREKIARALNMTFILGRDDGLTNPVVGKKAADILGAEAKLFNGGHNPLQFDANCQNYLIEETLHGASVKYIELKEFKERSRSIAAQNNQNQAPDSHSHLGLA